MVSKIGKKILFFLEKTDMVLRKRWLFSIGNGPGIRPLEIDRKSLVTWPSSISFEIYMSQKLTFKGALVGIFPAIYPAIHPSVLPELPHLYCLAYCKTLIFNRYFWRCWLKQNSPNHETAKYSHTISNKLTHILSMLSMLVSVLSNGKMFFNVEETTS